MNKYFNKNFMFFSVMLSLAIATCPKSLQAMHPSEAIPNAESALVSFSTVPLAPTPNTITIQTASGLWIAISKKTALQPEYKNILRNQYGITVDAQGNAQLSASTQAIEQITLLEETGNANQPQQATAQQKNSTTGTIINACLVAAAGYGIYKLVRFITQKHLAHASPGLESLKVFWSWE